MMTPEEYEAKRKARYERIAAAAERAEKESSQSWEQASKMAAIIPFGQPILVGHHSEGWDRRYRSRIESKHRKGYELHQKAEGLRQRAEAIAANDAIFSDDPQATEKLGGRIAQLEARQERMKAANKLIRKNDREGLAAMGYSEAQINRLFTPDFCGRVGYPDFEITNNGANIRRLKERLQAVEKKQAAQDNDVTIKGVKIEYRPSENRIRATFPERVSKEIYNKLRSGGFRVAPSFGDFTFSAYYNYNAAETLRQITSAME